MRKALLRGTLAVLLAIVLLAGYAPTPTKAGGSGHWAKYAPILDGTAPPSEWGDATLLTYTHFKVRYQNDAQFLYILIDVTDETPPTAPTVSHDDNFAVYFDNDDDGTMESGYGLEYVPGTHPMKLSTSTDGTNYSSMGPCASYGAYGFGTSLSSSTNHRVYETAIRLSEITHLPGHAISTRFYVGSVNPAFTEYPATAALGMASPAIAYIYNTPAGLAVANTYQTLLYNAGGVWADLIQLNQAASIDYSPYQAIIMGDDTGAGNPTYAWLGTDAAATKIWKSQKPVVGIGLGGIDFFDRLGLFLNHLHSWEGSGDSVAPVAANHSAWTTPRAVPTTSPMTVYVNLGLRYGIYIGALTPPIKDLTLIAADTADASHKHFTVLAQKGNNSCYTLWGFRTAPEFLTPDGRQLLANLVWQPACRPAVLYFLGGTDISVMDGVNNTLPLSGFAYLLATPGSAPTLDYSGYGTIVIGWDTYGLWTPAGIAAVKASKLPVVAMGKAGIYFLQDAGVPMAINMGQMAALQTQADLASPLQAMLRRPYPVEVTSTLLATVDISSGGAKMWLVSNPMQALSETVMGYPTVNHAFHTFATQPSGGTCYGFYGLHSYLDYMSPIGFDIFRNMLTEMKCNNPVFLPAITR